MATNLDINQIDFAGKFEKGMKDLISFTSEFLVEADLWIEPAKFHYTFSDILLKGKRNICVESFRESGKTTLVLCAFPLYRLLNPGKKKFYMLIITKSASESAGRIRYISEIMRENPLFSWYIKTIHKDSAGEGGVFEITTKLNERIRIEGAGKGGSIRGALWFNMRPDIVVLDDIQDNDDMFSEQVLLRDWQWFNSDVKFLSRHGRVFMIGNNLGEKCLAERVIENAAALGFDTMKIPVLDTDGQSVWAGKYSTDDIKAMREDAIASDTLEMFERELMCNAVAEEGKLFPKEFFRFYDPLSAVEIAKRCNVYMLTDYAVSQKDTADYRVILILGIDAEGLWFVLDCEYGRWDEDEFEDRILRSIKHWKPLLLTFEVDGQQKGALLRLQGAMARHRVFCQIVPVSAGRRSQAKFLMIKELQPLFANGRIWFPEKAVWLGEMLSELGQITKSGKLGRHDDLPNALAYGLNSKIIAPSGSYDSAEYDAVPTLGGM